MVSYIFYFQNLISIQAYQIVIGCFLEKARFITSASKRQNVLNEGRLLFMNQEVLKLGGKPL